MPGRPETLPPGTVGTPAASRRTGKSESTLRRKADRKEITSGRTPRGTRYYPEDQIALLLEDAPDEVPKRERSEHRERLIRLLERITDEIAAAQQQTTNAQERAVSLVDLLRQSF